MPRGRRERLVQLVAALLIVLAGTATGHATSEVSPPLQTQAAWAPSISRVGLYGSGTADLDGDGREELVMTSRSAGNVCFWTVWRRSGGGLVDVHTSVPRAKRLTSLTLSDPTDAGSVGIVVAWEDYIEIVSGSSFERLRKIELPLAPTEAMVVDVDADGRLELLTASNDVFETRDLETLVVEWSHPAPNLTRFAVGQTDTDEAREVALAATGEVLDGATGVVEWHFPPGFVATEVSLVDLDADGRDDVLASIGNQLTAHSQTAGKLWESAIASGYVHDVSKSAPLRIASSPRNSLDRLQILDAQGQILDTVHNPSHGVSSIELADFTASGALEVVFGTGIQTSSEDYLVLADVAGGQPTWRPPSVAGPYRGLAAGDVDADGDIEVVIAASTDGSTFGGGRLLMLDWETRQFDYRPPVSFWSRQPPGLVPGDYTGVELVQIDTDPQLEVCLSTTAEIACLDGQTLERQWSFPKPDLAGFQSLHVADIDGDGALEVVAGAVRSNGNPPGPYVYALDAASGALEWRSAQLSFRYSGVFLLESGDFDGDGETEVAVGAFFSEVKTLDGATGAVETTCLGLEATAMTTKDDSDGRITLVVGGDDGGIRSCDGATGAVAQLTDPFPAPIDVLQRIQTNEGPRYVIATGEDALVGPGLSAQGRRAVHLGSEYSARDSLLFADLRGHGQKTLLFGGRASVLEVSLEPEVRQRLLIDGFETGDASRWQAVTVLAPAD